MKTTSFTALLRIASAAACLWCLHGGASAQLLSPRWTTLPSPNPGDSSNQLYGLGGTGPNDVWAVGTYGSSSNGSRSLALHWDGQTWTHVPTPTPLAGDLIKAVAAVAPEGRATMPGPSAGTT